MSIIQKMSRAGWILVGLVVAVLLFPSVATAASTVYNGIVGTSGHKADVSPTSQLLTAEAAPSTIYHHVSFAPAGSDGIIATPPSGHALIVTELSIDFTAMASPDQVEFWVGNASCDTLLNIAFTDSSDVWDGTEFLTTGGIQQVPVSPGIAIPASDRLCASTNNGQNNVMISGYSVTSSTVTAPR